METDTSVTERLVSRPNFPANIAVFAAHGAEAAITIEASRLPLKPHAKSTSIAITGRTTSRKTSARQSFPSLSTEKPGTLAR